ncbi:MAG: hypothetical protein AAB551_01600 [Patescibacteria group bacterium]
MAEKLFQFISKAPAARAPVSQMVSLPQKLFIFTTPTVKISATTPPATTASTSPATPSRASQFIPAPTVKAAAISDPFLAKLAEQKTDSKSSNDVVFQSLIKTDMKATEKKKSILGDLPKIDTSLFIDREYHLKKQLSIVRFVFAGLLVVFFGMYVFFASQLNPDFDLFGQNVARTLDDKNAQLKTLQTDVNLSRIESMQTLLANFAYSADGFLEKFSEYRAAQMDAKKAEISADLDSIRQGMYEPFEKAREKMLARNWITVFRTTTVSDSEAEREFDEALRERLRAERKTQLESYKKTEQTALKEQLTHEMAQNFELLQLVGNVPMKTLLQTDIRSLNHEELKDFIGKFSAAYPSRLGLIYQIKEKRVPWARTIREISVRTKNVDPLFRTGFFAKLGGILYNAFDFEGSSGRIGLTGQAKSDDGSNFSILANLVDELEGSIVFKDVDMRSFSKRLSDGGGYEGSFKIDFRLQTELSDPRDRQYDLRTTPDTSRATDTLTSRNAQ